MGSWVQTARRGFRPLAVLLLAAGLIGCAALAPAVDASTAVQVAKKKKKTCKSAAAAKKKKKKKCAPKPTGPLAPPVAPAPATPVSGGGGANPTSAELIDQALADGDITSEQAILYRVYAVFADPRLPSEFAGPGGSGSNEDEALDEAREAWETLSQATRDALDPFFLPPFHAGSWYSLRHGGPGPLNAGQTTAAAENGSIPPPGVGQCVEYGNRVDSGWQFVGTTNGKVKIWWDSSRDYYDGASKANSIKADIDGRIWGALGEALRQPAPDAGSADVSGPCRGGDDRVDLALNNELVPTKRGTDISGHAGGFAEEYGDTSCEGPGYTVIRSSLEGSELRATVAHELAHLGMFNFNLVGTCSKYIWMHEATATWFEDHAYPTQIENLEHKRLPSFLTTPEKSLELYERRGERQYGAYLFFFYLARKHGASTVKGIWNQTESHGDQLDAIEAGLSAQGGLDDVWPAFARHNWNRDPIKLYESWDAIQHAAKMVPASTGAAYGGGSPPTDVNQRVVLPTQIPHLGAKYYGFSFTDDVNYVEFKNDLHGDGNAHVQAMVHIAGQGWKNAPDNFVDWSDRQQVRFCRLDEAQAVDQIYIVISNAGKAAGDTLTSEPAVITKSTCPALEGQVSGSLQYVCKPGFDPDDDCVSGGGSFTTTLELDLVAVAGGQGFWNATGVSTIGGHIDYPYYGTDPRHRCNHDVPSQTHELFVQPSPNTPPPVFYLHTYEGTTPKTYDVMVASYGDGTVSCTDGQAPYDQALSIGGQSSGVTGDPRTQPVTGTDSSSQDLGTSTLEQTWTWNIRPVDYED